MNKKGTYIMLGVMIGFMVIITGIVFIEPLKEVLGIGRNNLECGSENLSTGEEGACIVVDSTFPIFLLTVFASGIAYVGLKRRAGGE